MWLSEKITFINNDVEKNTLLECLHAASQLLEVNTDVRHLNQELEGASPGHYDYEIIRLAKKLGLKARWRQYEKNKSIGDMPAPCIVKTQDKGFIVLLRVNHEKVLLFSPDGKVPYTEELTEFSGKWEGKCLLLGKPIKLNNIPQQFNLQWFLPVFWRFKRYFLEVLTASCFLQIFALVSPLFTQVIIDKVLVHRGVSTLDVLALGLILIAIFQTVMGILRTYLFSVLTNKVDVILGAQLFRHIVSLPLKYFEIRRVGDTVARVRELENIRQFISGSSLILIIDTVFCLIFILAMFYYSVQLSLVALGLIPFMVVLNVLITPIYRRKLDERFNAGAESQSFLVESVTGVSTVKALALENQFIRRWENLLAHYVSTSFSVSNIGNIASNIGRFLQQISSLSILWFGAHLVMDSQLSVGQLIAFQMLSGQVSSPILRLVNVWQQFQQTRLSIDRLGDILNSQTEGQGRGETAPITHGEIIFDKVSFRYRFDGPQIIKDLSLKIPPGMMVGIVGPSGSGKSTLAKLVQRLYDPESGRVLLDKIDISQYEPGALRRQIGTVMQDTFLFRGTIRENIAIARPTASAEDVTNAAKLSGAHEFIQQTVNGYDTIVGERGDSLSGGQKQKMAIARSLLAQPRILIFDEATSALDALSEREVMGHVERLRKGRTIIMIAHRLATVKTCDVILVMDNGRIIEHGSHNALLKKKGVYYKMYCQQEGVHDVEEAAATIV